MFERYTEKARRVVFFARYEASLYGSPFIETEHLLLGLLREDRRVTVRVLEKHGGVEALRQKIEAQITVRERISTAVEMPLSAESKRILNLAAEEAERLSNKHVGTEHLLLGMLRETQCFAARLLGELGYTLEILREEVASAAPEQLVPGAVGHMVCLSHIVDAWSNRSAAGFARYFAPEGQFVDPQGNLSVGVPQILEAAHGIFKSQGWVKCKGIIEDVQFVGAKAAMATLAWEPIQKTESPNPGCVRMTVILTQSADGWSVARIQATGLQPQARSAVS